MLERLKLQDEIIKMISEESSSEDNIISNFKSATLSVKSIRLTINNLVENGYLDKRKANIGIGFRYSLTLRGRDRLTHSFENEYLDAKNEKNLQLESTESSIILTKEQIKQISSTNRIARISLLISTLLAIKMLFFENRNDSHNNYTECCCKTEKDENNIKDSIQSKVIEKEIHNSTK